MAALDPLLTVAGRIASFETEQRLPKRRASANKKKAQTAILGWPHKTPSPEQLAQAGFYYKPTPDHTDSVTCFFCDKSLDSWDPTDNPAKEHLAHVPTCAWAINVCIEQRQMDPESREQDPLSKEMTEVRRATFQDIWPHEKKKGWKCKVKKMVDAGWSYNPLPEGDDCVTCFYCSVSLDGWEPKDDPWEEHKRRAPDCDFFNLVEKAKQSKPQTKAKRGRQSRTSKTSRLSTMSSATAIEAPSFALSETSVLAAEEDSVMTTATTASTTSKAGRGGKKGGRAKAAPKSKSRGKPVAVEEIPEAEEEQDPVEEKEDLKRSTRQRRAAAQPAEVDNAPVETDGVETEEAQQPKRKATQKKRAKESTVSVAVEEPSVTEKPKRGRKRTSDGAQKPNDDSVIMLDTAPSEAQPKAPAKSAPKKKKASTAKKPNIDQHNTGQAIQDTLGEAAVTQETTEEQELELEPAAKPKRGSKAQKAKLSTSIDPKPVAQEVPDHQRPSQHVEQPEHAAPTTASEPPQQRSREPMQEPSPSPSAQSSDAENKPPSSRPSLRASFAPPQSPTAGQRPTTRVPLAPATPSRVSPSKRNMIAGNLISARPWTEVDVEAAFLPSPSSWGLDGKENAASPHKIMQRLTSPEKKMSVEEWVAHNAKAAEERLKRECERLVGMFEKEGVRALQAVEGIECD